MKPSPAQYNNIIFKLKYNNFFSFLHITVSIFGNAILSHIVDLSFLRPAPDKIEIVVAKITYSVYTVKYKIICKPEKR